MKALAAEGRADPPLAVGRAGDRRCRSRLAAPLAAALLALALLLAGEPVAAVEGGKALALVIGNGTYREDRRLDNPISIDDARLLAEALRKSGFTVSEGRDLDRRRFLDALEDFGRRLEAAGPGAVALFFYSGRAVRREGVNYFLPTDVRPSPPGGLPAAAIHSGRVIEHLTRANVRVLLIIVDAAWKGAQGTDGPGLAPLYGPPGTLVFLSTEPGRLAASAAGRAQGVFAQSLADALDIDGMSVERMARDVRTAVMAVTNGRQVPWSASSLMGENFYFGSAMRTVGTLFWKSIESSTDHKDFEAYLARFPKGDFAAEARRQIGLLKTLAARRPAMAETARASLYEPRFFKDCAVCPEMAVIPAGAFVMGDDRGDDDERPAHRVHFASPFAIGRYEVTFADFDACVDAGGCSRKPADRGWGRGARPAIDISWDDARQYVAWLSLRTGKPYRIPSEAEWEYAARGGSAAPYWWGSIVPANSANCRGCGSRWDGGGTAPVGSFRANRFGLFDVHGNVAEFVEDCAHRDYFGAPTDGLAWTGNGDCEKRMVRGGSWDDPPDKLRASFRIKTRRSNHFSTHGLRVARNLD